MADLYFKKMALIGVGLIGGSLALDCREKRLVGTVSGFGRSESNLQRAIALGIIDDFSRNISSVVRGADLVVLAVPVGAYRETVATFVNDLDPGAILTDVGSVKGKVVEELMPILGARKFVPAHPIAGKEKSGAGAATTGLFRGARCVLTPATSTSPDALEKVRRLWEEVGAKVSLLSPREHDEILGLVSHLPHLVAYALVNTVLQASEKNREIIGFSGGGFRDFTRIGASSPEMWRDIFMANRDVILEQIGDYERVLGGLKQAIRENNGDELLTQFERSRSWKERIH